VQGALLKELGVEARGFDFKSGEPKAQSVRVVLQRTGSVVALDTLRGSCGGGAGTDRFLLSQGTAETTHTASFFLKRLLASSSLSDSMSFSSLPFCEQHEIEIADCAVPMLYSKQQALLLALQCGPACSG
jgi:hypothetical protein